MRVMVARKRALFLTLTVALTGVLCIAQAAPETPAAPKPKPKPTPEQQVILDQVNSLPTDKPAPKIDTVFVLNDGTPNPGFGKVSGRFLQKHQQNLKRKEKPIDLLFIGDSITQGWDAAGKKIWDQRYAKLNAANFGIGGDRTEHVLWRIEQGELDGISPKVVVLMIGTNNGSATAEQVAAGVKAIVGRIREKLPNSKLLLLGIFPRTEEATRRGAPHPSRLKLMEVNKELAKLHDGDKIHYLEIWKQFLAEDGTLPKDVMPDALHPNEKGYQIWADAMQSKLDELM